MNYPLDHNRIARNPHVRDPLIAAGEGGAKSQAWTPMFQGADARKTARPTEKGGQPPRFKAMLRAPPPGVTEHRFEMR